MTGKQESMGDLYVQAMESAKRFVNAVRPDQWHVPTPCAEWDMRVLVNHITYENMWAGELFQGKTMAEVGDRFEGDLLGEDPIGAYNRSVEAARKAVQAPGAMERTTHLSFGDVPGSEYASQLFLDLLVHGWDVAKGAGQNAKLDSHLVEACIPVAEEITKAVGEGGPYGSRMQLSGNATPQDRLLALVGRSESWRS